jgi:hypothetical protein
MLLEVSGEDLRKQLNHIKKNLKGGRRSILYLEVYEDVFLLVYRNIEMPIRVFNAIGTEHKLRAVYTIVNYDLLQKLIAKFSDCDTYSLDFYPNAIRIKIGTVQFEVAASLKNL